jgi:hypothetical protein
VEQVQALEKVAAKLVDMAIEGDLGAIRELGDRIDGKAVQALEVAGANGEPIPVAIYLPNNGREQAQD